MATMEESIIHSTKAVAKMKQAQLTINLVYSA